MNNSVMSGIYATSEWVMRFSVINMLWIIFNLPVLFIIGSILMKGNTNELIILIPLLCIVMPLFFFPATQAMFASMRSIILKREERSLTKMYWRFYKENYKNSFLAGLLFTILAVVSLVDIYFFSERNIVIMFVFVFISIILYVYMLNYFSVAAHYDMRLRELFKNALLLTLGSPLLSFTVLISSGMIVLISVYQYQFLFFFFSGSLIAFLAFSAFYQTTKRLQQNKEG